MALTDTALRSIRATDKPIKMFDGHGLFLLVSTSGSKSWRLKYYFNGKEKLLSLGKYPLVSLKEAREKANEHRKILESGIDPSIKRKQEKISQQNTFSFVANEFVESKKSKILAVSIQRMNTRLRKYINPEIGNIPIHLISAPDILAMCKKVEPHSTFLPHALRALCSNIFRYGIATGVTDRDPARDICGALKHHTIVSHPTLTTPEDIAKLLLNIETFKGAYLTRESIKLLILTFTRSKELRFAEWSEFSLEEKLWRIPASKMKMRRDHIVPLSTQVIDMLRTLYAYTGDGKYVFPNRRNEDKPISHGALLLALRQMGYEKTTLSPHGFRAMASTMLNEMGYNGDWIERQLAHAPKNIVRGVYNRAEYLPERRKMMQDWADWLDDIKEKRLEQLAKSKT